MSGTKMSRMLQMYLELAPLTGFLKGMFTTRNSSFHNTETVEIDVIRSSEKVAVVVQDMRVGYRMNTLDKYVNKEFTPPVFKEATTLNVFDLFKRDAGEIPFSDPNFQGKAVARAFKAIAFLEEKIMRAIELQASQVLQTGKADLADETGTVLYQIDYKPKTAHFVTVGTAWSNTATANPFTDIAALARVIRSNGKMSPDQLIFGRDAWYEFTNNDKVKAVLNRELKIDTGAIERMEKKSNGGTYHGSLDIENYRYELWTYDGAYEHPQTAAFTDFVDAGKVVVRSSKGRLDMSYGAIPRLVPPDGRVLPYLPGRISDNGTGRDLFMNAWIDQTGENLSVGVATRPLCIPVAIDTFGCLTT